MILENNVVCDIFMVCGLWMFESVLLELFIKLEFEWDEENGEFFEMIGFFVG